MSNYYNDPIVYDNLMRLSIKGLIRLGLKSYLKVENMEISWRSEGCLLGNALISFNSVKYPFYVILKYSYNSEERECQIELLREQSNLKKGFVWFFLCPIKGFKCKKLFFYNGYFVGNKAIPNGIYRSQLRNGITSPFLREFELAFKIDDLYDLIESKHFKKTYRGIPTKRYLAILNKIKELENYSNLLNNK